MKKITRATIKSFIKTNWNGLYIKSKSSFDGMVDCVMPTNSDWKMVEKNSNGIDDKYTLGIKGAWFVGQSNDYFREYEDDYMVGYEVYNSCGSFLLAFKK